MDDLVRMALHVRHLQRRQHQLRAQVIRHRPADDPPRERIEHDPQGAAELLDESLHELNQATAELRELARGIHPAVLTSRGLHAALKGLATRSPVPVELLQTPADRLPPAPMVRSEYSTAAPADGRTQVESSDAPVSVEYPYWPNEVTPGAVSDAVSAGYQRTKSVSPAVRKLPVVPLA